MQINPYLPEYFPGINEILKTGIPERTQIIYTSVVKKVNNTLVVGSSTLLSLLAELQELFKNGEPPSTSLVEGMILLTAFTATKLGSYDLANELLNAAEKVRFSQRDRLDNLRSFFLISRNKKRLILFGSTKLEPDIVKAKKLLQDLNVRTKFYSALVNLATIEFYSGDAESARGLLTRAIDLFPQVGIAYFDLGLLEHSLGHKLEAARYITNAAEAEFPYKFASFLKFSMEEDPIGLQLATAA